MEFYTCLKLGKIKTMGKRGGWKLKEGVSGAGRQEEWSMKRARQPT